MPALVTCLTLLTLVSVSALVARLFRSPLPFVQIAIGAVAALPPFRLHVLLEPAVFLLLFIPPLLFADGWTLPRRELLALRWPVLGHAVGLVLFTVAVGGYALHWLIPAMPLSVAFAVAALVSPTDAVAVSAITARLRVPRQLQHLLESEALLNDASGLVAMQFAVAATMSGAFYPSSAAVAFVAVAAGGLAIGCLLTLAYARLHRRWLNRPQDAAVQTAFTALLPFAAYAIADELGVSGILAAVAAGITANAVSLLEQAHLNGRLQLGLSWGLVSFCLNGVVFVLLGLQLPDIIGSGPAGVDLIASTNRVGILGYVAALMALLIAVRLFWVLLSLLLGQVAGHRRRPGSMWLIAASSIAGVRGVVTLAGVLSLPLLLPSGAPFPSRDLAVTLATGVILLSMLIAALGLPPLLRRVTNEDGGLQEIQAARIAAAKAAIATLSAGPAPASKRHLALVTAYRDRLAGLLDQGDAARYDEDLAWRTLQREALQAERNAIQSLRATDGIDDTAARQLLGELDLQEATLLASPLHRPEPATSVISR